MRLIHLRVKVKTLAAESRIIRAEARKVHGITRQDLNEHRKGTVRAHARANQLAYGLLRGVSYRRIEVRCVEKPSFDQVKKIARRFGGDLELIDYWIGEARNYLAETKKAA